MVRRADKRDIDTHGCTNTGANTHAHAYAHTCARACTQHAHAHAHAHAHQDQDRRCRRRHRRCHHSASAQRSDSCTDNAKSDHATTTESHETASAVYSDTTSTSRGCALHGAPTSSTRACWDAYTYHTTTRAKFHLRILIHITSVWLRVSAPPHAADSVSSVKVRGQKHVGCQNTHATASVVVFPAAVHLTQPVYFRGTAFSIERLCNSSRRSIHV